MSKECPACAEEINDKAIKCRHCGEYLDGRPKQKSGTPWLLIIGICGAGFVVVIGILAAMILPALGKARMKAKEARSKSNLKQIYQEIVVDLADKPLNAQKITEDHANLEQVYKHPLQEGHYKIVVSDFDGSADKILAYDAHMWSTGMKGQVYAVFQDGHVGTVPISKIKALE